MTETTAESDMSVGMGLLFGFVALFAAIATGGTAYVAMLSENADLMQLFSGIALAVAIVAGGLTIVAIHVYQ